MPIYTFECEKCGAKEEMILAIRELNCKYSCSCGGNMLKKIDFEGGLQTEHPSWLGDDVRNALQGDGEKPIKNRTEYNQYLEDNGIVPRG